MKDFKGFDSKDFSFFLDMSTEQKRIVKRKMEHFGNMVYGQLDPKVKSSFRINKMATIREDLPRAIYSIGKAYQDRTRFQLCGLAITLDLGGLAFRAVIRGGSFRDKKAIGILYDKISKDTQALLKLFSSFGEDYFFKIFSRVPTQGDKIRPDSERWLPVAAFNLRIASLDMLDYILAVLEQENLPGVQISHSLKPGNILLQDPKALLEETVKAIEKEYGFLDFIEN